jgi:hypothetical protein
MNDMNVEYWWNDTDKENSKYSEKNLPLCSPQIPHGLAWDKIQAAVLRG